MTETSHINSLKVPPGSQIIFFDKKTQKPPGKKTGCNQIGIFISHNKILFCRKRTVIELNFNELAGSNVSIVAYKDTTLLPKIARFFDSNRDNYRLFALGTNALFCHNYKVFNVPEIMPKFGKQQIPDSEYEASWNRLISKMQKGDTIFTFNSKSLISKIIAKIDNGSWSHTGTYVGNGEISEMISTGYTKRSVEVYKQKHIHIGIYRFHQITPEQQGSIDDFVVECNEMYGGQGYPFFRALKLGIRTLLHLTDGKYRPQDFTPNGIVYAGTHFLVDYI